MTLDIVFNQEYLNEKIEWKRNRDLAISRRSSIKSLGPSFKNSSQNTSRRQSKNYERRISRNISIPQGIDVNLINDSKCNLNRRGSAVSIISFLSGRTGGLEVGPCKKGKNKKFKFLRDLVDFLSFRSCSL